MPMRQLVRLKYEIAPRPLTMTTLARIISASGEISLPQNTNYAGFFRGLKGYLVSVTRVGTCLSWFRHGHCTHFMRHATSGMKMYRTLPLLQGPSWPRFFLRSCSSRRPLHDTLSKVGASLLFGPLNTASSGQHQEQAQYHHHFVHFQPAKIKISHLLPKSNEIYLYLEFVNPRAYLRP